MILKQRSMNLGNRYNLIKKSVLGSLGITSASQPENKPEVLSKKV